MNLKMLITEVNVQNRLKITGCQQAVNAGNCNWDCCVYTSSYCLMLPGEYEAALEAGYRVDGYDIVDDNYFGGKKVVPASKKCCVGPEMPENHYKTLDCWFYPVWPWLEQDEIKMIIGTLCPLQKMSTQDVREHALAIERYVKCLVVDPAIDYFLRHAKMVGYEHLEYQ